MTRALQLTLITGIVVLALPHAAWGSATTTDAVERMIALITKEIAEAKAKDVQTSPANSIVNTLIVESPEKVSPTASASYAATTENPQAAIEGHHLEETQSPFALSQVVNRLDTIADVAANANLEVTHVITSPDRSIDAVSVIPYPDSPEVIAEHLIASVGTTSQVFSLPALEKKLAVVQFASAAQARAVYDVFLTGHTANTYKEPTDDEILLGWEPPPEPKHPPKIEESDHKLTVSGSCSNTYYVVALYRFPGDFIQNPDSALLKKSYLCIGNSYSYELEIPPGFSAGTYYILAGEQGITGGIQPRTKLTEITIRPL